ncbi:MAG: two-component regulator propeller domain-containing protein, partial [Limisphaerales bacterium]
MNPLRATSISIHRGRSSLFWVAVLGGSLVSGAAPAPPEARLPVDYSIRHWSGKDGLPLRAAEAILQTKDGFIWFGMNNGLGRFDGEQFQIFDPRNTPALTVSYVTSLAEGPDGSLWIGTGGGGLVRYAHGTFERFAAADGLSNEQVKALHFDRAGDLWIGTDGGGLFVRYAWTGRFRAFTEKDGLPEPFIFGITEDPEGNLLLATYKQGPWRRVGERFEPIPLFPPHTAGYGFALTRSPTGRVWLGAASGVYRLQPDGFHRWEPGTRVPGHDPVVAWEFEDDDIWLGTAQGLVHWRKGAWTTYPIGGGSSGRLSSAFIRDREGSIWKSPEGTGVVQLRRTKFVTFGVNEGLSDDVVTTVCSSRDGSLWVGTPRGLHRFARGRIDSFNASDGLPDTFVFSVAEDSQGVLWVATRLGGIALFRTNHFVALPKSEQPTVRGAWCITPTRDGSVWVGTSGGAFQYRDYRRVRHLHGSDQLTNDDVRTIAEGPDGSIWFGTSYGLNRLHGGQMTSFTSLTNLPPIEITISLAPEPDGTLWIGTMTRGLFRLRNGEFAHFGTDQGLPADGIQSITPDRLGRLWLGTPRGILAVPIASLDAVAAGSSRRLDVAVFGRHAGLISEECSGSIQPTATLDSDGRLWVATSEGLATSDPAVIRRNATPPLTHIDRLAIEGPGTVSSLEARTLAQTPTEVRALLPSSSEFGEIPAPAAPNRAVFQVANLDSVVIPPGEHRVEFKYSGLSFVTPEAVGFQYRLENYDTDWVNAGNRRVAYYTRVPPGRYRFHVRAINEDDTTSAPATLAMIVAPTWWQTTWLRITAALGVGGLAFSIIHARIRNLRQERKSASELSRHLIRSQEQERSRIAAELHDGIGQELQLIRNRSELAL